MCMRARPYGRVGRCGFVGRVLQMDKVAPCHCSPVGMDKVGRVQE
jgi:hypothetical protein